MAEDKIKLTKKIISNKLSNKLYTKSFSDLTRSSNPINDEKIYDLYQELFYSINKKGKKSHESIILESRDYLYPQVNNKLDSRIEELIEEIERLNQELLGLKTAAPANSEYPNGSFITAGNDKGQFQGMPTIWVMQDGMKRKLKNVGFYKIARAAFKVPGELFSELYMLSVEELNQIPDGLNISRQRDFSATDIKANYGEIYQRLPYYTLKLYCEGREADDSYDLIAGDFWLDDDPDDACKVTYVKNEFEGDEENYTIEEITIPVRGTKVIEVARDRYDMVGIPREVKNTYDDYYNYDLDIQQDGTRLWGKDKKYKGILLAEGRILMNPGQEKFNTKTNESLITDMSFDEMFGNRRKIYSHGCKNFLGEYEECFGDLNQGGKLKDLFDDPEFNYYQASVRFLGDDVKDSIGNSETSNYNWTYNGTFMNWPQTATTVLNHRTTLAWQNFPVYGQPILNINGKKVIYLKSAVTADKDLKYHYFYNLEASKKNKSIMKIHDNNIDFLFDKDSEAYKTAKEGVDSFNALSAVSLFGGTTYFNRDKVLEKTRTYGLVGYGNSNRFNWEAVDPSRIKYIGLSRNPNTGEPIKLAGYGNENYFNPFEDGSNFEITPEVQNILNPPPPPAPPPPPPCNYTRAQLIGLVAMGVLGGSGMPQGCSFNNCLDC